MSRQSEIDKLEVIVDKCRGLRSREFASILVDSDIGTSERFKTNTKVIHGMDIPFVIPKDYNCEDEYE